MRSPAAVKCRRQATGSDELAPARGILLGLLLGTAMWTVVAIVWWAL